MSMRFFWTTYAWIFLASVFLFGCGNKDEPRNSTPNQKGGPQEAKDGGSETAAALVRASEALKKMGGRVGLEKDKSGRDVIWVRFSSDPGPSKEALSELRLALVDVPIGVRLVLQDADRIDDTGLALLSGWKTLRFLVVESKKVTDTGLKNLIDLPGLEGLTLFCPEMTDAGLVPVGKLTHLRYFDCYTQKITADGYANLSGLANLEYLHAGSFPRLGEVELSHIAKMSKLHSMDIGGTGLTDAGLAHLKAFPELPELQVLGQGSTVTSTGLAHLSQLKKIEKLRVQHVNMKDNDVKLFAALTSLKELDLAANPISNTGIAHLKGLTNLKILNIQETKVTPEGVANLKRSLPNTQINN
jgi:hypothetical protein